MSSSPSSSRRVAAAAALLTVGLALTACSGGGGNASSSSSTPAPSSSAAASSSSPAPSSETASAPASDASATATDAASSPVASGGTAAPVKVSGTEIKDPEMGETIAVTELVRHFDPAKEAGAREIVLLNLTMTASDKYSTGVDCADAKPLTATAEATYETNETTSTQEAAMTKAGYKPLERARKGETTSGWCAYTVQNSKDTKDDGWVLYHKRLGGSVLGTTKTIPAQEFKTPIKVAK